MKTDILFLLLRLGLGLSSVEDENTDCLKALPIEDWVELMNFALEQGVDAIVMDGIQRVYDDIPDFSSVLDTPEGENYKYDWLGLALGLENENEQQISVIKDMSAKWNAAGYPMLLFKGQANGLFYPNPLHRPTGDIDCYLFGHFDGGNNLAEAVGASVNTDWYKHSQIHYRGETFENHQFFVHTREGKRSKDLEQLLLNTLKNVEFDHLPGTDALLPPPMFNALFLTYHALTHFLEEGLRLKQLIDWAMFLHRDAARVDWPQFYSICEKYHLRRFADVTTDIAVHRLGIQLENSQITTSSPYSTRVIHSTLTDNDYVFNSGQSGWSNRWHIVRNLIKYRWKYHQIYQHSVLRQIWYYTTGYLFKTE